MATGTGKTYTGLGAVSKLSEDLNDRLAVIIVCPYQHLVEQWVEDIVRFNMRPIIGYSSSSQKDWKNRLAKAVRDQKLRKDRISIKPNSPNGQSMLLSGLMRFGLVLKRGTYVLMIQVKSSFKERMATVSVLSVILT